MFTTREHSCAVRVIDMVFCSGCSAGMEHVLVKCMISLQWLNDTVFILADSTVAAYNWYLCMKTNKIDILIDLM